MESKIVTVICSAIFIFCSFEVATVIGDLSLLDPVFKPLQTGKCKDFVSQCSLVTDLNSLSTVYASSRNIFERCPKLIFQRQVSTNLLNTVDAGLYTSQTSELTDDGVRTSAETLFVIDPSDNGRGQAVAENNQVLRTSVCVAFYKQHGLMLASCTPTLIVYTFLLYDYGICTVEDTMQYLLNQFGGRQSNFESFSIYPQNNFNCPNQTLLGLPV